MNKKSVSSKAAADKLVKNIRHKMSSNSNDPVFPEFANIPSGRDRASHEANNVRRKAGITRDGVRSIK